MPSDTQQPPPATNPAPTTSLDSIAPATIYIAPAVMADLDALVALENMCFVSDRLTRRQFRYMLQRAQSVTLVARLERRLIGYVSVLFKRATSVARLYSIAVAAEARRMGVARALVAAAEQAAWVRERDYLRLEIRHDNLASQRLFERLGYRRCGIVANYYADRMTALRYEKMLVPELGQVPTRVPFYEQPLDFTCGASALMIAMKRLAPELMLDRALTLRIRREATTIFVTSEYGGCGPFGLALAAHRRGFDAEVFVNDLGVPLIGTVRGPEKKARMRWVHENMLAEIQHRQIPVTYGTLSLDELATRCAAGAATSGSSTEPAPTQRNAGATRSANRSSVSGWWRSPNRIVKNVTPSRTRR